jgi:hypothetical protein
MKNLFLALFGLMLFSSCATDDSTINEEPKPKSLSVAQPCFNSIDGTFTMDLSDGLGNPTLKFGATVQTFVSGGLLPNSNIYVMYLQVQPLADCEDMNSDTGSMISFSSPSFKGVSSIPTINLKPVNIPFMCYKWRVAITRIDAKRKGDACTSVSDWYDAPLY